MDHSQKVKIIYDSFLYENKSEEQKNYLISTHMKLENQKNLLKKYELKFKNNKSIVGLKYQSVKVKIDFIQISVIFISTLTTFIEALKEHLMISEFITTILPVICSSYIALILAVSRFYKFEDMKENLSKLFEKNAFVINRLKYKLRMIDSLLPIDPSGKFEEIDTFTRNIDSDGLQEVITQAFQETDVAIVYKDRLYYENLLFQLHLDAMILKKNLRDLETYEDDLPLNTLKRKIWLIPYYLCCYWSSGRYIIDDSQVIDELRKVKQELPIKNPEIMVISDSQT